VESGARINSLNNSGLTPLFLAVQAGNRQTVEYLVDHGAFLDVPESSQGCTELQIAVAMGYGDIAEYLVRSGSCVNTKDHCGQTPLDYAFRYGQRQIAYDLLAAGADDSNLAGYLGQECPLAKPLAAGEAEIFFLGHSGWAIKTQNHFLIFDYFSDARTRKPDDTCLASGFIVPADLKDLDVTVFSSHAHPDHFDRSIFDWQAQIPGVQYVLCFNPPGIEADRYTYIPVNGEAEVDNMKIYVNKSTDLGGGFLVEVDGLVIFHMGDHSNGDDKLMPEYCHEIDLVAEKNASIDILFSPIRGCSLGTPSQVSAGIDYAIEKLHPELFIPMHSGGHTFEYKKFTETAKAKHPGQQMDYVINRGDWLIYSKEKATAESGLFHDHFDVMRKMGKGE
jgi:L-ascorbate metabolism protein UlaG (beta-lactamase superfamily)